MVTIEIAVSEEQAWKLLQHAHHQQRPVSEDVVAMLAQVEEWEWRKMRKVRKRAAAVVGTMDFGAPDVARRHDDYFAESVMPDEREKGVKADGAAEPEGLG